MICINIQMKGLLREYNYECITKTKEPIEDIITEELLI